MPNEFYHSPKALEFISQRFYEFEFPALKFRSQIPLNNEGVDPGDEFYAYEMEEVIGAAKVSHTYGKSAPRVNVRTTKTSQKIIPLLNSYEYSVQDVRNAMRSGKNLPDRKARAARTILERSLDELMFLGSSKHKIEGLLNNSLVPKANAADIGGGVTQWSGKTADQIVADVKTAITAMTDATNGLEGNGVTMLLPYAQYIELSTARIDGTGSNVLTYIMQNIPNVVSIQENYHLKAISGSDDRMVLYTPDDSKVSMVIPLDVMAHEAQLRGLVWETPVEARSAGVAIYKPYSLYYMDKI